jgi:hypothetical protein
VKRLAARRGVAAAAIVGMLVLLFAMPAAADADDRGLDVAAPCRISSASLQWGIKASFRDFVQNRANGQWIAADGADYVGRQFRWEEGTGNFTPSTGAGLVGFIGSVTFTGRAGVLTKVLSNPELQFVDARHAFLLLDVDATTGDGGRINTPGVQFAKLDLAGGVLDAQAPGVLGQKAVPARLTAAGAKAFGHYEEGRELDPVRYLLRYPASCVQASTSAPTVTVQSDSGWLTWLVLGLGALAIGAVLVLVVLRRRTR